MANSTSNLDLVSASQSNKEVTVNAALDAASPAMLYGRRALTTAGLSWGYYGGTLLSGGTLTAIPNGTVSLAASSTNYVEADATTGAVSANATGFTAGKVPLYQIVTGGSGVTSYTDRRAVALAGAADAALAAHIAATDPHPQYLTQAEGDARYAGAGSAGVSSVNSKTGTVTLTASDVGAVATTALGSANGAASLGSDGKLPTSQLPNLAIIDFLGAVANQTAMLALSGQKGDWCTRSDNSKVYVITGSDPTQISSWTALSYPTGTGGTVTSVDLAVPGLLYTVSGGPVTGSGTLTFALKTQAKNTFLCGPASGADAAPTMRTLTAADLPAQPFDVTAFYPGVPAASAKVTRVPLARAVSFPANFSGSVGIAAVAATSSTAFDVQKNGVSVGTITFAAGASTATFTTSGAVTFAAGDYLSIIAPATPDATLADPGIVLAGTR